MERYKLSLRGFINSVRYKYIITTLLFFISILFAYTYLWYSRASDEAEKSSVSYVNELLRSSNENIDVTLKDVNNLVAVSAANQEMIIDFLTHKYDNDKEYFLSYREIRDYFVGLFSLRYYISGVLLAGKDKEICRFGLAEPYEKIKQETWFEDILNTDQTVFVPPHYINGAQIKNPPGFYDDMAVSIAKKITTDNQTVGVVCADIKCDVLLNLFNTNLKDKCQIIIYDDKKNEVVFRPAFQNLPSNFNNEDFKQLSNQFDEQSGNFRYIIGGKSFLVVYYKSKVSGWTTMGLISRDKLLESFSKTKNNTILIALLFFFVSAVIAVLTSSALTRNLLRLSRAINAVGKDNMDISLNINSNDEVGILYRQFNAMVGRIKQLIEEIKVTEREKRKSEIIALQLQINPHFLYNTLNTIKIMSGFQGAENIKQVTESLSNLLYISLEKRSFIEVEEEMNYLKCYLNIQEYKYSNKFSWDMYVEAGIEKYMLPKLTLQPLVENALLHGIGPLDTQGVLSIKIYREAQYLTMRVQDNGKGISRDLIQSILNNKAGKVGIGIHNVISRMKLYFGDNCRFSISSEENMFSIFEISIPLIKIDEVENYV